jgi:predicted RNA-binding protein with PIN domain
MKNNLTQKLIIDGYNLIEAAPQVFQKMLTLENRRSHILKIIQSTPHLRSYEIVVVFDGNASKGKPMEYQQRHIQIRFSGTQQEADQVIQEMIRKEASGKSLHIISSDREIQNIARDHHAQVSSSQQFWKQLRRHPSNRKNSDEPHARNKEALSEREVQEWLEIFRKGKPEDYEI